MPFERTKPPSVGLDSSVGRVVLALLTSGVLDDLAVSVSNGPSFTPLVST